MNSIKKCVALSSALGGLLALNACGHGESLVSSTTLLNRGWTRGAEFNPPDPLYCYNTLGQIDCYDSPLSDPGAKNRLVVTPFEKPPITKKGNEIISCPSSIETHILEPIPLHENP